MEHLEGEQYSQYPMEGNSGGYMSMRDYRNLPWKNQQPWERNPNPPRSIRDYRDQWMSTPSYSVTPTYAPPPHPQYAFLPQPQPPQPISLVEQEILDLTKLVGDAVEEQKKFNAQLSQKIHTVENSLEQKLDGLQSEVGQQFDSLQCSISRLSKQHVHQEEENTEEVCLTDTMVEEQCQQQGLSESSYTFVVVCPWEKEEEITALLTEDGSGKEEGEEPQKLILHLNPINLDPSATAQPQNSLLPVYILQTPAVNSKPATPAPKAKSNPSLPTMQNFKRLVASVQNFATTSKNFGNCLCYMT